MVAFLLYPFYLFSFWYKDVIGGLINFFIAFNRYVSSLLSLPQLIKTYFKPLKNEYREGLVLFSIVSGIFIKTILIVIDVLIVLLILCIEVFILLFLIALPILLLVLAMSQKQYE